MIIATGARVKRLGLEKEAEYWQSGLSAFALCDGAVPISRNKPLALIVGGDSAPEEATCRSIFLLALLYFCTNGLGGRPNEIRPRPPERALRIEDNAEAAPR